MNCSSLYENPPHIWSLASPLVINFRCPHFPYNLSLYKYFISILYITLWNVPEMKKMEIEQAVLVIFCTLLLQAFNKLLHGSLFPSLSLHCENASLSRQIFVQFIYYRSLCFPLSCSQKYASPRSSQMKFWLKLHTYPAQRRPPKHTNKSICRLDMIAHVL